MFDYHQLNLCNFSRVQPQQQQEDEVFDEESAFGDEDPEEVEEEKGPRNRALVELDSLLCKTRQMLGNMTTTGGKVLLTALLGLTGNQCKVECRF